MNRIDLNIKRSLSKVKASVFFVALWSILFCPVVFSQNYSSKIDDVLNTFESKGQRPSVSQEKVAQISPEPYRGYFSDSPWSENRVVFEKIPMAKDKLAEFRKKDVIIDVLELKDMDIDDVLKLISKKSGLNIVSGKDVKAKVTIYLKQVSAINALRIILESYGMAYVEENGIIKVMNSREYEALYGRKFDEKTETNIVHLTYAHVADIVPLLVQMKSSVGKVISDDKSNTLILTDTPDNIKAMEIYINNIDIPVQTAVFDLSYAKAEDLSGKIQEALTKNVGTMKFDKRSNKIHVTDTPQKIEQIQQLVSAFDEKEKEVLIEAKIMQITLTEAHKMGVDWEALVSGYHTLKLDNAFDVLSATDKYGKLSIGTLSTDDYTVLIEGLKTIGDTKLLSSPRITALNNEEAKILVGSTQPYVTTTTTTTASGPVTTAESVNFVEVGVKLYVTPTIHNDGFVTMKIKPEVSSVISYVTTSNNNQIPVVDTSEAETTVMVKDGVTIVIGGLIKDEKIDTVNKVPVVGDIPIVGLAFRNKDKTVRKTELVIFLTPRIMSGDIHDSEFPSDHSWSN